LGIKSVKAINKSDFFKFYKFSKPENKKCQLLISYVQYFSILIILQKKLQTLVIFLMGKKINGTSAFQMARMR
jgi:hypothetical protein